MKNKKTKIIFFGTANIGVPAFDTLITDKRFDVLAVVTQIDKPVGRKQILTPSLIKTLALKRNIPVFQPQRLAEIEKKLLEMKPDLIVDIAYAKLVPENILSIPKYGCINVHASLLPKYRGAACVQAPIINGDSISGITVMKMDAGLDTGPMLKQFSVILDDDETSASLHEKLAGVASAHLPDVLLDWVYGKIEAKEQNNEKSSYVPKIKKEDGYLDFSLPAQKIERLIRAYTPWPNVYGYLNDEGEKKLFKLIETEKLSVKKGSHTNGQFFIFNDLLAIACGTDALIIKQAQIEGKRIMSADELLRGHKDIVGKNLS